MPPSSRARAGREQGGSRARAGREQDDDDDAGGSLAAALNHEEPTMVCIDEGCFGSASAGRAN